LKIDTNKLFTGLREAEMVKLTMNCYLATMISFSAEMSDLCEVHDIDATVVMQALKMDSRISKYAPIKPGLGFSGGTIERDVIAAKKLGSTNLLDAILSINEERKKYITKKLKTLLGDLTGKTITFFGATYKSGTDTLRDSPTIKEIKILQRENGVNIKVYDPLIKGGINGVQFLEHFNKATDSDAIVIMTDWAGWKDINYVSLNAKIILDAKGVLSDNIEHFGIGVKYGKSSIDNRRK
jgi:UDPglucose 6-dehydrogenase